MKTRYIINYQKINLNDDIHANDKKIDDKFRKLKDKTNTTNDQKNKTHDQKNKTHDQEYIKLKFRWPKIFSADQK